MRAIADDPGVVHENVEPAMSILYLLHHRFDLLRLRHVALDRQAGLSIPVATLVRISFVLSLRIGDVIDHALRAAFSRTP